MRINHVGLGLLAMTLSACPQTTPSGTGGGGGSMAAGGGSAGGMAGGTAGGAAGGGAAGGGAAGGGAGGGMAMDFSCDPAQVKVVKIPAGDAAALAEAVNNPQNLTCTTFELAAGTYALTNVLQLQGKGITLQGVGKGLAGAGPQTSSNDLTVLDFSEAQPNSNGVQFKGERFAISNLTIWNAKKDALRIEDTKNVKIQKVRTEWAEPDLATNGAYGIYPVKSENVLIEDCEAYNASDAGIYVGQTKTAVLRRNVAKKNVAGIEIENTQFADVYDNTAEDNTAGLVVFDLPGNPLKGTDIRVHNNTVQNNNRKNFASTGVGSSVVSQIPAGVGSFILASRRVDFFENKYLNNDTVDISVLSGLSIEPDPTKWAAGGLNFATSDVLIQKNTFGGGSGDNIDANMPEASRPLGQIVAAIYGYGTQTGVVTGVEPVLFDGISPKGMPDTTNETKVCVIGNMLADATKPAVGNLNLTQIQAPLAEVPPQLKVAFEKTSRAKQGEAPYNCPAFAPAVAPVMLP
jgi:parallel beta-helix repeat protein